MTVTVLGAGDWVLKRDLRLRALQESPAAFASTYERERRYSEGEWREWPRDGVFFAASGPGDRSGEQHGEPEPHSIACGWLPLREPDVANLISMWVAPEHRGQRVAAALIDAVVEWAREQDRDHLELEVAAGNEAARKAYERHGFEATGKQPFTEGGTCTHSSCGEGAVNLNIPAVLRRNALAAWGSDGERWLADLPRLVANAAERWELTVGKPFGLSYNWVTAATRADGTPAVLKLGPARAGHLRTEAEALDAFVGLGAVRVLERDDEHGAILLERAIPGTRARDSSHGCPDDEAIVAVARRLHREPPPGCALPDLGTLRSSFVEHLARFPGDDPLPRRLVDRANQMFLDLLNNGDTADAAARRRVVLHGDLHHDNVLAAEREPWLAIDPLGVIGDPGFDAGAMLYNPEPERRDEALLRLVPGRVELLADGLGLPVERVRAWGFVVAVLSEVWTAEGGEPVGGRPLDVALLLEN